MAKNGSAIFPTHFYSNELFLAQIPHEMKKVEQTKYIESN